MDVLTKFLTQDNLIFMLQGAGLSLLPVSYTHLDVYKRHY